MSVNNRFSEFLEAINISQGEIADLFEVSRQTIGAIEHSRSNLTLEHFCRLISKYPELNYRWLLFGEGEMLLNKKYISDKENHFANNEEESPTYECKNPGCKKRIADLEEDKKVLREFNLNLQQQLKKETGLENSAQVGQYAKRNKTAGT